jgi:hypothetical protein
VSAPVTSSPCRVAVAGLLLGDVFDSAIGKEVSL